MFSLFHRLPNLFITHCVNFVLNSFSHLRNTSSFKSSLQLWTLFHLFSWAHILCLTDCVLLTGGTLAWPCGLSQKQSSYKLAKQAAHKVLLPHCSVWWPSCRRTDAAAGHLCPTMHYASCSNLKTNIIYLIFLESNEGIPAKCNVCLWWFYSRVRVWVGWGPMS